MLEEAQNKMIDGSEAKNMDAANVDQSCVRKRKRISLSRRARLFTDERPRHHN
jgi:hypothetical protein